MLESECRSTTNWYVDIADHSVYAILFTEKHFKTT